MHMIVDLAFQELAEVTLISAVSEGCKSYLENFLNWVRPDP